MTVNSENLSGLLEKAIRKEDLPVGFAQTIERYYAPLADHLAEVHRGHSNGPLIVGINGGQGSGKSTLAQFLRLLIEKAHSLKTAVISLDDLYLTRADRTVDQLETRSCTLR